MDAEVLRALRVVIDPELGLDIVSLGLVYGATREGPHAHVTMTVTSPACPLGGQLSDDARSAVETMVAGVEVCDVDLVFEPRWGPERLSPEARAQLGYPTSPGA